MDSSSRPRWSNDNPPIGRPPAFAAVLEEVVPEVDGDLVILQQAFAFRMLKTTESLKVAQKQGKWWWSNGQRPRPLLQRSEFESCWLLNLHEKTKINERGLGWPI